MRDTRCTEQQPFDKIGYMNGASFDAQFLCPGGIKRKEGICRAGKIAFAAQIRIQFACAVFFGQSCRDLPGRPTMFP